MIRLIIILACLVLIIQPSYCAAQEDETVSIEDQLVYALFVGYQEDDLIFQIVNKHDAIIKIRGLTFNGQILYRPLNRKPMVTPVSEESLFTKMMFRAPSDFVWSHNHMDKFQLSYILVGSEEKLYASLYNSLLQEAETTKSARQEN